MEYYRGDQRVFSSEIVVGSVFALTGIRPRSFAVNCDTRYAKHFADDLISVLKDNAIPTLWLLRKVLAEEANYAAAVRDSKLSELVGLSISSYLVLVQMKEQSSNVILIQFMQLTVMSVCFVFFY